MTKPINGLGKRQKAFVEDLRSGLYDKINGALRDSDGNMCTLGVACQSAIDNGFKGITTSEDVERTITHNGREYELVDNGYEDDEGFYDEDGTKFNYTIPDCVVEYYGFYDNQGKTQYSEGLSLMDLNDETNLSLSQIGDLIAGNPRNYFAFTV